MNKRGLTYQEAMAYVGVKRRTFDTEWRPHLVAIPQGTSLIFDRADLDRLFDEFKADAAGDEPDEGDSDEAHNRPRNGRPINRKGANSWANKPGVSTPTRTRPGRSTSGGGVLDFASVASAAMKKLKAG